MYHVILQSKILARELKYHKSGNFHVEMIHVVNIHVDLFSWFYGTHENILTWTYFNMNI